MAIDWWNKEFKILVTMGESTTAGGGASCRERSWPGRLAAMINDFQRIPVHLVNVGIGANVISTSSPAYEHSGKPAASERIDADIIAYEPDLLVISYGLNDARGGTPLDQFSQELEAIILRVRERIQPLIVLAGPYYMVDFTVGGPPWAKGSLEIFREYNRFIEALAGKTNCLFADLLTSYREAQWLVHCDGVHANDLGHRIVANKIFEVLAGNCSGLSLETKQREQYIPPWCDESTTLGTYFQTILKETSHTNLRAGKSNDGVE